MPVYFFSPAMDSAESEALEQRIRRDIPKLQKVDSVEDLSRRLPPKPSSGTEDTNYVLFPFFHANMSAQRLVEIAARGRDILFFIFISDDISASDYKLLVRAGNADWASSHDAPQEIREIISRRERGDAVNAPSARVKHVLVSFVPSGGGVGNATLAMETAVQLKTNKATRRRTVCLIDLDFQTSHVCDLLDMEPRLQFAEISANPERLDAQLLDLFVSHHSSGLDVLACVRSKNATEPSIAGLDALFSLISQRYEVILIDLPLAWFGFTRQILTVSDLAVVTGVNTIPSLRQVAETVKAIRELEHQPRQIVVAINRSEAGLLGGLSGQHYAQQMLAEEKLFYIRDDSAVARQSVNTGVPVSLAAPSSRISKDIGKLTELVAALQPTRAAAGPG
jgi:pilus assembly protein CpaE